MSGEGVQLASPEAQVPPVTSMCKSGGSTRSFRFRQFLPSSPDSLVHYTGVYTLDELKFFYAHSKYSNRSDIITKVMHEYALLPIDT